MNYTRILGLLLFLVASSAYAQGPSRYSLNKGDQFKVSVTIKQNIDQNMMGQVMKTVQTIITTDLYEVVEASDTEYLLKTTGISRSLETDSPQGRVFMDSDFSGDDHLAFRALSGKSYYVRMNQYGRFISFEGMDEMKSAVKADLESTFLQNQADQLLMAFDEKSLVPAFEAQFFIYKEPEKPWSRSAEMIVNNLPITINFDFEKTGDNEISATGDMTLSGEFEAVGQMMKADMSGTQTSVFSVDPDTGLSRTIKTEQDMDGTLEVQNISIPMTMKTEVSVKITK